MSIDSTTRSISKSSIVTLYAPLPGAAASRRQSCRDSRALLIDMERRAARRMPRGDLRAMPARELAEVGSSLCRSRLWKRSPGSREDEATHVDRSHDRRTGQPMARMKSAATVKEEPSILVVDDYEDNRQMYAELLAYAGYRVEQAGGGGGGNPTAPRGHPPPPPSDSLLPA